MSARDRSIDRITVCVRGIHEAMMEFHKQSDRGEWLKAQAAAADVENYAKWLGEEAHTVHEYFCELRGVAP